MVRDEYAPVLRGLGLGRIAALTGDFQEAVRQFEAGSTSEIPGRLTMTGFLVHFHRGQHDLAAARAALANVITDTPLARRQPRLVPGPGAECRSPRRPAIGPVLQSGAEGYAA